MRQAGLFITDGSTGTIGGNKYKAQGAPSPRIFKHPTLDQFLFTLRQGDKWSGGGERNEFELDGGAHWANLVTVDYSFDYFVRAGVKSTAAWGPCITQVHSDDFSYDAPPFFLTYTADDKLRPSTDAKGVKLTHPAIATSRGVWHSIRIKACLDPNKTKSVLKIWHDGAASPQVDVSGFAWGYPTGKNYRKLGVYRAPSAENFDVFYRNIIL